MGRVGTTSVSNTAHVPKKGREAKNMDTGRVELPTYEDHEGPHKLVALTN
jgi:hypothetical protein